jgi:hypothetical protein
MENEDEKALKSEDSSLFLGFRVFISIPQPNKDWARVEHALGWKGTQF